MSDQMMPPQGGGETAISRNRSMLNPVDAAAMKQQQQGMPQPKTAMDVVMRMLQNMGVAPNDPAEKLVAAMKGQVKNATPMGKMQSMAQPQMPPRPEQPQGPQGLEGLMS